MSITTPDGRKWDFLTEDIKDMRVLRSMLSNILAHLGLAKGSLPQTPSSLRFRINDTLVNKGYSNSAINHLIKEHQAIAEESILSNDKFEWLKQSPEACAWVAITQKSFHPITTQHLNIPHNSDAVGHKHRLDQIIASFDFGGTGGTSQASLMRELYQHWHQISASAINLDWLSAKDSQMCNSAWEFLLKKLNLKHPLPLNPIGNQEIIIAIAAYLYAYIDIPDLRKDVISKMRRDWSKKKFNNKNDNRKPYNFNMSTDVQTILDDLVRTNNCTRGHLVEQLIRNEANTLPPHISIDSHHQKLKQLEEKISAKNKEIADLEDVVTKLRTEESKLGTYSQGDSTTI